MTAGGISAKEAARVLGWGYKYTLRRCEDGTIGIGTPGGRHTVYESKVAEIKGVPVRELWDYVNSRAKT